LLALTFQSRSGFSPCLDGCISSTHGDCWIPVSIPVWVFSLPRRPILPAGRCRTPPFQSRSGFSPCLDPRRRPLAGQQPVSIPVWVFSLPRPRDGRKRQPRVVSIPVWVFSLPRPVDLDEIFAPVRRFNPGLGFLPASTTAGPLRTVPSGRVSIPVWVFSLPRPGRGRRGPRGAWFQSRSGFSPCLDVRAGTVVDVIGEFQSRSGFSPCLDV